MRILLVEDDALLADGLARSLRQSGYLVEVASDGRLADRWLEAEDFDLTILDLGLPGLDGTQVLQRLRSRKQLMPVLVLSARMALEERVRLLDIGADDYVVKPVALVELEARVRALIRRGQGTPDPVISLGRLQLDTVGKRAWLGGNALELSAREWSALEFLATRVNRIVNKEQITQALYSWEEEITPNAIEKFISRLRSKLEPAGVNIRTVRGLGYYLKSPKKSAMQPTSLRVQLLKRLLPAMLALLLAGAATAYWVAWRSATKAYDRALFDTVLAIAEQLRMLDGTPQLPLTPQARAVLLTDKFDRIFYAVHGPKDELLDGDKDLPIRPSGMPNIMSSEGRYYFDGWIAGTPIRVAALQLELDGHAITVLAGETMIKRNALVREIILGMLLPELLLALVSISVVWFGVRSGLRPLSGLRQELAGRSQADLRPVRVDVPEEMQPVVTEINELLQRLEHSLISQRNFVSDAAHQLRTPIAALQAQVEASLSEASPDTRQQLEGILAAAHRLSHLVAQMLALARAEPSLAQTQPEVSLEMIVHHVAEVWLPRAFAKQIDLGFELAPAFVRGNNLLLQELLGNLLDNALRYTPHCGTITVACGQHGAASWLSVEDSGPGISTSECDKVFERFYQPPGSRRDGNGLGLAIVREIARQHGGQVIAMTSPKLGGALLKVTLPPAATTEIK